MENNRELLLKISGLKTHFPSQAVERQLWGNPSFNYTGRHLEVWSIHLQKGKRI